MILAYSNTPKLYRQFSYQVSDQASQNALPLSSSCQGAHFLQLAFKSQSLKILLNSQVDVSMPFPWYLLFFKLPLYSFPLMYLIIPQIRCPLNIPISVDYSVYLTPCPFLLPAQNSPQQTQCLKIYRPWKCLSPNLNWPMYLEVLDISTPLPCKRLSFHSPIYLIPWQSFCSTVSRLAQSCLYILGISLNQQSSNASL